MQRCEAAAARSSAGTSDPAHAGAFLTARRGGGGASLCVRCEAVPSHCGHGPSLGQVVVVLVRVFDVVHPNLAVRELGQLRLEAEDLSTDWEAIVETTKVLDVE